MGGLFSKKPKSQNDEPAASTANRAQQSRRQQAQAQVSSKDKAILELKNARDRLKKYQKKLDLEAIQLQEQAIKLLKADKRERAKLALKVKKFKEQQIQQADQHLMQVLEMVDTVEWESQQLKVFEGLKAGNSVLDEIHKEMSIEAVENLMLETEEAQEIANEIGRMLGNNWSPEAEDEVLKELEEIERQEVDALAAQLPEVPTEPVETDKVDLEVEPAASATASASPVKTKRKATKEKEKVAVLS